MMRASSRGYASSIGHRRPPTSGCGTHSYYRGDGTKGTLTSPPFRIERKHINFLIGGGMHPGEACIDLLVGGEVVRTSTGPNDRPGGSERLDWDSWDVGEFAGREAVIRIVDRRTGGWGHINIDHIVQSGTERRAPRLVPAAREVVVERRYLHFPVKNGAPKQRLKVSVGEAVVDEFEIELAGVQPGDEPDFRVFLDMEGHAGGLAKIETGRLPEGSDALSGITQADEVPGADELYREKYRPQFHFSSRRGWSNDPNGMVYHDGEYHLYYQHNPYGWSWGNMHWGHAVSDDLVRWKELPIAIYPHRFGDWAFSGGAVVDRRNTAGFRTGEEDVIVASFTSTGRGESIAYSNDRGRTFTDYEGNPVVKHRGRDPKVIWYEPGGHWVMAVYDEKGKSRGIAFYTSDDLKKWEYRSRIDGYYECPELFELPVDGDDGNTRWVLYAADGEYAVGDFDGRDFTPEHEAKRRFNWGNCFYASQTFSDIPPEDGRRIQIAWGRVGHRSMPFNQMMNFPVALTLCTTDEGIRMFAEPVREIESLHDVSYAWRDEALPEGANPLDGLTGDLFHIRAELEPGDAAQTGFEIRGIPVAYDVAKRELSCRGRKAPLQQEGGRIRLEILVDRTSVEIFANAGRIYMPIGVIPPDDDRSIAVFARGAAACVRSLEVHGLRSAWEDKRARAGARP